MLTKKLMADGIVFITLWTMTLPLLATAVTPEEYPLELVLLLRSYSAGADSNFYKCGSHSESVSMSMCGYQLQAEAASDGVAVGHVLFDKQVYKEELKFEPRQDAGFKNPIRFNLTSFPHNLTVTLTLHYYTTDERKTNRRFHAALSRIPLATLDDSTDETINGVGWSSFAFTARIVCRPYNYGAYCGQYCRPESPLQYCSSNGELLCQNAGSPPSCSSIVETTTKTATKTTTNTITKTTSEQPQPQPPGSPVVGPDVNAGGATPGSLDTIKNLDPLMLALILCGVVLAVLLLASGLSVALVKVAGRKRRVRASRPTRNGHSAQSPPISLVPTGPSSVDVHFESGVYRSRPQPNLQPQPPPPLTSADCDKLFYHHQQQLPNQLGQQRDSGSGSSCLVSASAVGYEPLRLPDGADVHNLGNYDDGGYPTAGTLPIIRPPRPFATDTTTRSVSRYGRNVLAARSFEC